MNFILLLMDILGCQLFFSITNNIALILVAM